MAAPKTVITIRLDGSNKDFEIPFEYLARKFVVITLIGTDRKVLTLGTDYRFTQRTIITTTQSWGPAQGYTLLEIRRLTSATERLVDFSDGSVLRAYDLNISNVQSLHIAEEGRDIATDTIGVDNDGNLDARGRRIVNLADAINDGDAVTLKQNREWAESALNQANRATQQATIATQQATIATTQATTATTQATTATQRANASEASRVASEAARDKSKAWATAAEGVPVDPGLYSAFSWAKNSQYYAGLAQTNNSQSATNNQQSYQNAVAAGVDANRAKTEADRAKTEADKLGNFNGLAGALDTVSGVNVTWKGQQIATGQFQVRGDGDVNYLFSNLDGSNNIRWTRNAGGLMLLVDDARGVIRMNSGLNGDLGVPGTMTAGGNLRANGGVLGVRALLDTGNAGLWFYGTGDTTRSTIYSNKAGSLILFPAYGMGGQPVTIAPNGQLNTLMGLALDASSNVRITNTGELISTLYPGGSVKNAMSFYDTGFFAVTASRQYDFTHGLFQAPVRYAIQIKCVTPENGYAVGDIINCPVGLDYAGGGLAYGFDVRQYNATTFNLFVGQALRAYAINKGNTAVAGPTPANWQVRVVAYAV